VLDGELVRNQVMLHVINKQAAGTTLRMFVEPNAHVTTVLPQRDVSLDALESRQVPVLLSASRTSLANAETARAVLRIVDERSGESKVVVIPVLGPEQR